MFTTVFIEFTTSIRLKELWDFFMKTIMYNKYTQNLYGSKGQYEWDWKSRNTLCTFMIQITYMYMQ